MFNEDNFNKIVKPRSEKSIKAEEAWKALRDTDISEDEKRQHLIDLFGGDDIKAEAALRYPLDENIKGDKIVEIISERIGFEKGARWKDKQFTREKQALIDKACKLLVNCIEDYMSRRMEVWDESCKKQTLENLRKVMEGGEE